MKRTTAGPSSVHALRQFLIEQLALSPAEKIWISLGPTTGRISAITLDGPNGETIIWDPCEAPLLLAAAQEFLNCHEEGSQSERSSEARWLLQQQVRQLRALTA